METTKAKLQKGRLGDYICEHFIKYKLSLGVIFELDVQGAQGKRLEEVFFFC